MNKIEFLYDYLTNTEEGINIFLQDNEKSLFLSFIIFSLSIFSQTQAALINNSGFEQKYTSLYFLGLVIKIIIFISIWILLTSIYHFICSWKKHDGNIINLFMLLGLSFFPFIFLPPGAIISKAITPNNNIIYIVCFLAIFIWSLKLQLQ